MKSELWHGCNDYLGSARRCGWHCSTRAATWPRQEKEKAMKVKRVFRPNPKSPQERELRDGLQAEKLSLDDLVHSGASDPDAIMTMGMYFDLQKALHALKRDRKRCGMSIDDVAARSGLDRAVVSRLENGKQDNPTVATLMRYAAATGKRFLWTFDNLETKATGPVGLGIGKRGGQ
jgi:DNA-binding XRE family transcriptional regulator